jgi:hypothetical protein
MPGDATSIWDRIAERELREPGVTAGTGFGRNVGVRVDGKIFAFRSNDALVVKLPRARVDELVDSGQGRRFDSGGGRVMKEWVAVDPGRSRLWAGLVAEAREYVRPGGSR